jgi:DNA-binding NarL/FixJ family response regulator
VPIRVVLADDHTLVRSALARLIEREEGMVVVGQSEDGRGALELVTEKKPDLVVMDVTMPGMNGIDATRRIVGEHTGVRVLALSAYTDRRFVAAMLEAGASGYLRKDCDSEEFLHAVRRVAGGGTFLGSGVSEVVMEDYLRRLKNAATPAAAELTPREREVVQLIAEGHSTKEVADILALSPKTVETHRGNIMAKLGLDSVAALTKYAIREGLTSLDH